ncbi:hypothetical protein, partial [uncultured Dubosiella sp.]|uniref:hypothetical protein n=1 Tax=uncultured Dubosiella sp. TaxID=1937011 RepID=UPI00259541CE
QTPAGGMQSRAAVQLQKETIERGSCAGKGREPFFFGVFSRFHIFPIFWSKVKFGRLSGFYFLKSCYKYLATFWLPDS